MVHHSDFELMYVIYFVKNKEKFFVSFFFDLAGWSASTFLNIVKSWTKSAQLNRYLSNNHGFKLDWPRNKLVIIMTSSGIPGLMVVSTGQVPDILGLIPYYCPSHSHGFESWLELDFLLTFCLRNYKAIDFLLGSNSFLFVRRVKNLKRQPFEDGKTSYPTHEATVT